jgi:hypothetical protein
MGARSTSKSRRIDIRRKIRVPITRLKEAGPQPDRGIGVADEKVH